VAGETESHAPPEVVLAVAAQLSVPWPLLVKTNVCVVAVEPVAVSENVNEVDDKTMAGLAAGCTRRMRRLPRSTMYRLFPESNASPATYAIDAAVAGPPSPEKPHPPPASGPMMPLGVTS
jgi:hypothetical protein